MNDFRFYSPALLLLLLVLPIARFALGRFDKGARKRLLRFAADANLEKLLISKGTLRDRGKRLAFWAGLALAIVAAARPQANPTVEEVQSTGLDIYVLMDVSRSMDAEDIPPSRLLKAKRSVQHLTARLVGDRVGIIAYANSAVLITPLTSDYSIIDSYLKTIDTSLIPSQGTNVQAALEVAKDAMERGARSKGTEADRSNIFVVMSDGEDHGDSDLGVVDEIRKSGGIVYTIAFGTERGAPIPIRDEAGELRGFKTDIARNTVVSPMKPAVLKEIAQRGGGHFYFSTVGEAEVEDLLARVGDAQRGSFAVIRTTVYEEWFAAFLAPGLLLLLFSFVSLRALSGFSLARLAPRKLAAAVRPGVKPLLVPLLLALGAGDAAAHPLGFLWTKDKRASEESRALAKEQKYDEAVDVLKGLQAENPDNSDLNYNIGTYQVLAQKHSQGREQLNRLRSAEPHLRLPGLYNVAGSYALEGNKDGARAAYAELIQLLGRREKLLDSEAKILADAKRNLARLADPNQQPPPQQDKSKSPSGGGGGDDKKENKDKGDSKENKSDQEKKEDKDSKGGEGKSGDEKKDQKGQGGEGKEDKKDQDKKEEGDGKDKQKEADKKEGDQKKEQPEGKGEDKKKSEGDQGKDGGQLPPKRGGQPFRERDNMGEEDAKKILGALKEREGNLQKKFLKDKVKGGKVNVDDAAKDW